MKETYVMYWEPGEVGYCNETGFTWVRLVGGSLVYAPGIDLPVVWEANERPFCDIKAIKNPKLKLTIKLEEQQ